MLDGADTAPKAVSGGTLTLGVGAKDVAPSVVGISEAAKPEAAKLDGAEATG